MAAAEQRLGCQRVALVRKFTVAVNGFVSASLQLVADRGLPRAREAFNQVVPGLRLQLSDVSDEFKRVGHDRLVREFTVNLPLQRVALDELIDRAAWVPHVTIQSNVTTDADPVVVVEAVRAAIDGVGPVKALVGEEARFGPKGSFLVNHVHAPALRAMHDIVHARLRDDAGAVSIDPAADGDGFRAHVTVTSRGRVWEGDEVVLNQVLVAEIGPSGDRGIARPIATFNL